MGAERKEERCRKGDAEGQVLLNPSFVFSGPFGPVAPGGPRSDNDIARSVFIRVNPCLTKVLSVSGQIQRKLMKHRRLCDRLR
jgi:hypothetical protein